MAKTLGNYESALTGGLGHTGGEIGDPIEGVTRGQWAGLSDVIGKNTHYAVQIDMSDLSTDTDAARGLYAGFFRWVTERPEYDGVTVIPTGDNEGDVWKEGIIISRKQISPVDRIGNFNVSGDYASLSGFNLAIDNTSDFGADPAGFDDYLLTNGYEIINRPVKFYCIINDVFYQVWGGVVSEVRFNEKVFEFVCKDIFEQVHKPIPATEIVFQKFPNADAENIGKEIPVVFGDVLRTELFNIDGKSDPIQIGFSDLSQSEIDITAATEYDIDGTSDEPYLIIKTPSYNFPANYFVDTGVYYITVFKGTSQSVLIIGNEPTTDEDTADATTKIYLGKKLTETVTLFNQNNAYQLDGGILKSTVWFFKIYQFNSIYILSDKAINSIFQDSLNNIDFRRWNSDRLRYDPIPELIDDFDNTESNIYEAPNISLLNNQIDLEGDFVRLIPIFPESLTYKGSSPFPQNAAGLVNNFGVNSDDLLRDKDRSTSISVTSTNSLKTFTVLYEAIFPDGFVVEDLDELFLCFDVDLDYGSAVGTKAFFWTVRIFDQFEQEVISLEAQGYPAVVPSTLTFNGLPNEYYKQGDDNGEDSDFSTEISGTFISDLLKIASITDFKEALASKRIEIAIAMSSTLEEMGGMTLKQIGFYGSQKLNVIKDDLFVKTKGEEVGGNQTNNVYRAIRHILETYDEIPTADIDYGNLISTRYSWRVGRQLIERKLSSVYLKEIAAQSFVGIYPDRYGKRHTKSFLDDTSNIWTHAEDNGTIIKGSIKNFKATAINEVYNDFKIEYDWNPGLKQFNKSIFVTNTDARTEADPYNATFPNETESTSIADQDFSFPGGVTSVYIATFENWGKATMVSSPSWAVIGGKVSFDDGSNNKFLYGTIISIFGNVVSFELPFVGAIANGTYTAGTFTSHGSVVRKWSTWVGGINDYNTAKNYWEICYNSWLKTQTVNKLPEKLGKCYWFIDGAAYDGTGLSTDDSAAHKYLANLISWTTRQKHRTSYSIPVTKNNIKAEQLDVVKFKDQKYTNGDFRTGYIEKIKLRPAADMIDLEVILSPEDLETYPIDGDLIIETGNAPDTITELGDNPNTITETGL